jgi:hypothetical protein
VVLLRLTYVRYQRLVVWGLEEILGIPVVTGLDRLDAQPRASPGQQEFRTACFENGNDPKMWRCDLEEIMFTGMKNELFIYGARRTKRPDLSPLFGGK